MPRARGSFPVLFVLLVSCVLAPFCHAGLNDGLVAYYPFNGNANDESGNGNHEYQRRD